MGLPLGVFSWSLHVKLVMGFPFWAAFNGSELFLLSEDGVTISIITVDTFIKHAVPLGLAVVIYLLVAFGRKRVRRRQWNIGPVPCGIPEAILNGLGQPLYPMFSLDFIAISSVLPRAHIHRGGRRPLIRGPGATPKANPAVYFDISSPLFLCLPIGHFSPSCFSPFPSPCAQFLWFVFQHAFMKCTYLSSLPTHP